MNTPRSKKRLRTALIKLMQEHKIGKHPLAPSLVVQIVRLVGVLDGLFPPETAVFQRPKGIRPPVVETVPDYSPEALKALDDAKKILGGDDGHSNGDGSSGTGL
jgi:hypothetical protein